jgi:hypothetical protein
MLMPSPANDEVATTEPGPWGGHTLTYELKEARVVAVLHEGGGAIVEHHAILQIDEGRVESYGTDGQGQTTSSLAYALSFYPKSDKAGEKHTGYNAAIVITGRTADGRLMEIRGDGFIGQDELGQLDGQFLEVPAIYIPSNDDLSENAERRASDSWPEPKGEFVLATYGYAQDWS